MARQARNYLAGAVSGTALIGLAVVAFVMLVSLQTLRNWPLAALGIGGEGDPSSGAAIAPGNSTAAAAGGAGVVTPVAARGAPSAHGQNDPNAGGGQNGIGDSSASPDSSSTVVRAPDATTPESTSPAPVGEGGSSPSSPASGAASSGSGSGNGAGGRLLNPPGGAGSGGGGAGSGSGSSPSGTVTSTVNNTVSGVDEATGGTLGSTGVAKVTEEVVNGVAGPESTVGETVDKTVEKVKETVGGLLGGSR